MEDVSIRIRRGRALLDSTGAWSSGPVRDPAEVAESAFNGQPGGVGRSVEKSPEDRSIGSIPFDYSQLGDSGRAPDPRSDEPQTDLAGKCELPETQPAPQFELPQEDFSEQIKQTKEQMQTTTTYPISLIKHNQVKALALELMAERFTFNGQPKFTRVSPAFCDALERFVHTAITNAIRRHSSVGKVIKDF